MCRVQSSKPLEGMSALQWLNVLEGRAARLPMLENQADPLAWEG